MTALLAASPASARPGDLDPRFGQGGLVPAPNHPGEIAVSGGKAVTVSGYPTVELRRYSPQGSLDPAFGTGGVVRLGRGTAAAPHEFPDGRLAVGVSTPDSGGHVDVLLPGGGPDVSFAGDGRAEIAVGAAGSVGDVAVRPDGGLLVAASIGDTASDTRAAVFALEADGDPDGSFGSAGVADLGDGRAERLAVAADGTATVVWGESPSDLATATVEVTRLDAEGTVDTGFGIDGTRTVPGGIHEIQMAYIAQTRRVVVAWSFAAQSIKGSSYFNAFTQLDAGGDIVPNHFESLGGVEGLAADGRGRLLIAGSARILGSTGTYDATAYLARLSPAGRPDPGFGENGVALFPGNFTSFPYFELSGVGVGGDGSIYSIAGSALARFKGEPGGANDADADGIVDAADLCPRRSAVTTDGCEHATIRLRLRAKGKRRLKGSAQAPGECLGLHYPGGDLYHATYQRKVTLVHKRRGKPVRRIRGKLTPGGPQASFEFRRRSKPGRFRVVFPRLVVAGEVVCEKARSRVVR